jgi:hypothetical protein
MLVELIALLASVRLPPVEVGDNGRLERDKQESRLTLSIQLHVQSIIYSVLVQLYMMVVEAVLKGQSFLGGTLHEVCAYYGC